jgi:hypothetical protein
MVQIVPRYLANSLSRSKQYAPIPNSNVRTPNSSNGWDGSLPNTKSARIPPTTDRSGKDTGIKPANCKVPMGEKPSRRGLVFFYLYAILS